MLLVYLLIVRWKDEDDLLEKQVSAAEHLCTDWSSYENECEEAERLVSELECELNTVCADTDAVHQQTCYQQLQVCSVQFCDQILSNELIHVCYLMLGFEEYETSHELVSFCKPFTSVVNIG